MAFEEKYANMNLTQPIENQEPQGIKYPDTPSPKRGKFQKIMEVLLPTLVSLGGGAGIAPGLATGYGIKTARDRGNYEKDRTFGVKQAEGQFKADQDLLKRQDDLAKQKALETYRGGQLGLGKERNQIGWGNLDVNRNKMKQKGEPPSHEEEIAFQNATEELKKDLVNADESTLLMFAGDPDKRMSVPAKYLLKKRKFQSVDY